ncbi:hypothetical protein TRFO_30952 [Tritrichomonas foetus]|uniref:EGF-like domain-containing protein n=1 Tax=Tritrichomonas foetus TaxID=1144522 RepID=A0A1J4JXN2_9EUKA|nr:hypothetical protein TRFO_30952 [Tritrichomonas foetus]|eukprot:OHT02037.1 hypothetical protein TRFO_30952 [Tritrichomonas foetus]
MIPLLIALAFNRIFNSCSLASFLSPLFMASFASSNPGKPNLDYINSKNLLQSNNFNDTVSINNTNSSNIFPEIYINGRLYKFDENGKVAETSCQPGLIYNRYYNEIEFINPAETKIIDTICYEKFNFGYNSISVTGSYCPKRTGKYRVMATARPFVQIIMDGRREPYEIGPAGNCWGADHSQYSIDNMYLDANKCYNFRVNMRTGCTLYPQYLYTSFFYEDEDEYFPSSDEYVTCEINDCRDGYYGEHCDGVCPADCGAHGYCFNGTAGNGECVCDDHWEGKDCNDEIEVIPPYSPNKGVTGIGYRDEIGFTNPFTTFVLDTPEFYPSDYIYCGLQLTGSILPERSGQYQFRIYGKPVVKFDFMGTGTPSVIGPAAVCNNAVYTDEISPVFTLDRHRSYPFSIYYRSGCGLNYDKHVKLYWKNGPKYGGDVESAPWEPVPDFVSYLTTDDNCVPNHYGSDCEGTCHECPSDKFTCDEGIDGTGKCKCRWGVSDCYCSELIPCENGGTCNDGICECLPGYYGELCQRYCNNETTCHNHGYCTDLGYCHCDSEHTGDTCNQKCNRKDYCNGHGDCIDGGICQCDEEWSGNTCAHHDYQKSPNEMEKGLVYTMFANEWFSGGYVEAPHIIPELHQDFEARQAYHSVIANGAIVSYNKTKVEVRMMSRPFGEIQLNQEVEPSNFGPPGTCLPFESDGYISEFTMFPNKLYNFYIRWRSGCALIPQDLYLEWRPKGETEWKTIPSENLRANTWGQTCLERYFGDFCTEYCDSDCNMNGDCIIHDGESICQCFEGYYGEHCEYQCNAETDCNGHGICYNDGCICDEHHSGEHCEIGCTGPESCSYHGHCSSEGSSECICDSDYEGEVCSEHKYVPSLNETIHGVNFTVYSTENFDIISQGPMIIDNVSFTFRPLMFNSATLDFSIVPKTRVQGRLRFTAKPYGQLIIRNEYFNYTIPNEIGPSVSCWPTTVTTETTPFIDFYPNELYHITFKYKSGCSFFEQYFNIEWQLGTKDWTTIPIDNLYVPKTKEQTCLDRYSGEHCSEYCSLDCNMNGYCIIDSNHTERCECIEGAEGEYCENYCDPITTCNGHGICEGYECICDLYHSGSQCEEGCHSETTCHGHGQCTINNTCECDSEYEGETCAQHKYIPSINETKQGVLMTLYSNEEFETVENISIISNLTQTFDNLYYKSILLETAIIPRNNIRCQFRITAKPYGQIIISESEIEMVPKELGPSNWCWGWTTTENETKYHNLIANKLTRLSIKFKSGCCWIQQNIKIEWSYDSRGFHEIPSTLLYIPQSTEQTCLDRYFGVNCSEYCSLECNSRGTCYIDSLTDTEQCKCLPGFSGPNCETELIPTSTPNPTEHPTEILPTKEDPTQTEEESQNETIVNHVRNENKNDDGIYSTPVIAIMITIAVLSVAIILVTIFIVTKRSTNFASSIPLIDSKV